LGFGDDILATGLARQVPLGKRAAFGNGRNIIWGPWSEEIFRHNPRVARPGQEAAGDLIWIDHYKGHRKYNRLDRATGRWIWNYDFKPIPGEIFLNREELELANMIGQDFIFIEPNVPWRKSVAVNKDWGLQNYQAVADRLRKNGHRVVQSLHGRDQLERVDHIATRTFRHALAVLSRARAALLPEGGLHHGAAAFGIRAAVLFGGFIPPAVTGYDTHINFTGGATACGSLISCEHCRAAMKNISAEEVHQAVEKLIEA
jgi:ADP-heptose:LPS heptosyltransferase